MDKTGFRQEAKARLRALGPDRHEKDGAIRRRLEALLAEADVLVLAAYVAIQEEPVLASLMSTWLHAGRELRLPRYNASLREYEMVAVQDLGADLAPGYYGIPEPRVELDGLRPPYHDGRRMMWLIPGLGFDLSGHRLGRGGGYYDRLLDGATGLKTGVGYDCQIFDAIPCEPHDVGVDYVVTETRMVDCGWHIARRGAKEDML